MNFKLLKGNIVDAKVDAIVLPANTKLKEGSGTSEAIFKAAGRKYLTKACKEIGTCEVGSAKPTLGYNLPANYIIHAVVPKWVDGEHGEYDILSSAYASALELADVMMCNSIAFPLLASGNNGFDVDLAFEIAVKSIERYQAKNLEDVQLIVFDNHTTENIEQKGYEVALLPVNLEREQKEYEAEKEKRKIVDDAKDAAQKIMNDQITKGIEYFMDPDNRQRMVQFGVTIVKKIMHDKKKK